MSNDGLPKGWARTTLAEIAQPTRPRELPSSNPELPFIGMEHVQAHTMRLLDTVPADSMKSSAVHFQPNDVLYGRLRPYLNKVYRPDFEGLCSAEFIVFPGDTAINAAWLAYLLNSSAFVFFASHLDEGDRPRVDFDQIGEYEVLLSPRPEQDRIVAEIEALLSDLDSAVSALKRVQANLKRYRASVLKAACEGRLVPTEAELARKERRTYETGEQLLARILKERRAKWESDLLAKMLAAGKPSKTDDWKKKYKEPDAPDTTNLPDLPEGWTWASAESIAEFVDPHPSHRTPAVHERGIPYIGMGDVAKDGKLDRANARRVSPDVLEEHKSRYQLRPGDFFIGKIGTLGKPVKVDAPFDYALSANVVLIQPSCAPIFFWYMSSATVDNLLREGSRATTQAAFGIQKMRLLPCPVPPIAEQSRIVTALEEQWSVADGIGQAIDSNIRRASRLRQSILKRAFEGRLVPQDPNDEPASVLLDRIRAERAASARTRVGTNGRKLKKQVAEVGG